MTAEQEEKALAENAEKTEQNELEAESRSTRFGHLLRLLSSSLAVALIASLLGSSVMNLLDLVYRGPPVISHELSNDAYKRLSASLDRSTLFIARLESALRNNPRELATVIALKSELQDAQTALKSATDIKSAAAPRFSIDLFDSAHAQDTTAAEPAKETDHMGFLLFGLIGLVAFVLVAFCLMYMYTSDKTKKAFAEKTITTIIGFIFGLITGQMSAKVR